MRYRISHTTEYRYQEPVTLCHNECRLTPRNQGAQSCSRTVFSIEPPPSVFRERTDYFGNRVVYFDVETAHTLLRVHVVSDVRTEPRSLLLGGELPWEAARDLVARADSAEVRAVREFVFPSPLLPPHAPLRDWAAVSFPPGRPLLEGLLDLMHRVHGEFRFDPVATDVSTPLARLLDLRSGVCQDFAHLAIAALRVLGLPARYVSGYLETLPPPGRPKLIGADASHAWFEAWVPDAGWLGFDPTNDQMPSAQHVTVAFGRDYGDVAPLKGVIFGGGEHTLSVAVDVTPEPRAREGESHHA